MTYVVEFAARASHDLKILYKEKNAAESKATARWYNGLEVGFRRGLWRAVIFVGRCKC
jgi:hypothetical protein